MTGPQVIVLATPVFLLLIALEFFVGLARGRNTYRLSDALSSMGLGVMSQVAGVFGTVLSVGMYSWVFEHLALARLPAQEPCVYGTRAPLRSWNPLWANLQAYADLARDSWRAASWTDKLKVWLKPPGWRPADVAQAWPKPAFDIASMQRFDPPLSGIAAWAATLLFAAVLVALGLFLWNVHGLTPGATALGAAAVLAALWLIGTITQPRKPPAAVPPLMATR
jgi:hypothetical protein